MLVSSLLSGFTGLFSYYNRLVTSCRHVGVIWDKKRKKKKKELPCIIT